MSAQASVTHWLQLLQSGDERAAEQLWNRYFEQLVHLARNRLRAIPRRAADEEDVALSAFDSFCQGAKQGRFLQLTDRDNLWRLLVIITARKAIDQIHHDRAAKRGGGHVRGESALRIIAEAEEAEAGIEQIIGDEPSPEFAVQVSEEFYRLLDVLPEAELRRIALLKLEGHTTAEIAGKLDCAPRTVERKLQRIRRLWT